MSPFEKNINKFNNHMKKNILTQEIVCANGWNQVSEITTEMLDGYTSIGDYAFYWCSSLTSVTIPNSVTSIGDYAFYSCGSLTSITIPNSVTSIGECAFAYCTGLTSIDIPNSVTSIGKRAFAYCTGLTSIDIPNSVTSIGKYSFFFCCGLTSIVIPNSVTSIGDCAFANCICLTSIEIPNSVTRIGEEGFYNCNGLRLLTIPNSVTSIGSNIISYCSSLKFQHQYTENGELIAYKGFKEDMTCKGFQYEEGKVYEISNDKKIKLCEYGFHACVNPLDVLNYYDKPTCKYHEVYLTNVSKETHDIDTKVVGRKIRIGKELTRKDLINRFNSLQS